MSPGGCIFCGIVAGDVPADVVHQTDHTVAFRDINPQAPVHVLVIPRTHVENAAALTPEDASLTADLFVAARQVAEMLGVADSGFRLVLNVGDDALNTVPHLHVHVIGGRRMDWPPG